jgi:hypothetical protein
MTASQLTRRIRVWLGLFIAGLVLSGLTAFPLERELRVATAILGVSAAPSTIPESGLHAWLRLVRDGVVETNRRYPFLAYGTDWLAFGHLVIAVAFIGPFRDPVRNKWVITFGLIACVGVIPLALIAGHVRGIPLAWRVLDCCFGVFGSVPLLLCRRYIRLLEGGHAGA